MAEEFMERLAELVKKDPSELQDHERDFLNARRSYLTDDHITKFGLMQDTPPQDNEDEDDAAGSGQATKDQLMEALTTRGIAFSPRATKAGLQSLLDAANAQQPQE